MRPRSITVGLARIAKVRHEGDGISSLIELRLGQVGPNTNKPAKGKVEKG